MSDVLKLARPDIVALSGYVPAEKSAGYVRLHANESPWPGAGDFTVANHRYPDGRSRELSARMAEFYGVDPSNLLVTRGSDDAIDLLVRGFCRAGQDGVLIAVPTFLIYAQAARVQGASVSELRLREEDGFAVSAERLLEAWAPGQKLVFLCSPNNPTGNSVSRSVVGELCSALTGRALVVVDEAYIEYSTQESMADLTRAYANLAVLRTLSKAHGLAGARVGAILADPRVIALLSIILPPYPLAVASQRAALAALGPGVLESTHTRVARIRKMRSHMRAALAGLPCVRKVWDSDGNFLLVGTTNASDFVRRCRDNSVLVRDCSAYPGLSDCVRVTIGSEADNAALLASLRERAHAI